MRAVVLDVSPAELARRKRTGIDRFDEMWEGVLHMVPAPANEHQRMLAERLRGDRWASHTIFFLTPARTRLYVS